MNKSKTRIKTVRDKVDVIKRHGNHYITRDGLYMDVLKVDGTSGVRRMPYDKQLQLITEFSAGLRTFTSPFNSAILDFLVNHQIQIDFYNYKISKLNPENEIDQKKYYWLKKELDRLIYRQLHETEEQYFLFIFGRTEHQLKTQLMTAQMVAHLNARPLRVKEKDAFLYKMNNLNSMPRYDFGGESS